MELIDTYFGKLFHESGPKNCVPDCPAEIVPWFHPHAVFHAYFIGSKDCSIKAKQGLPFFTENYGPKWTEYTTVVHEIAGHHIEVWSCLSVCLLSSHHLLHLHLIPWTRLAHNASTFSPHPLLSCASSPFTLYVTLFLANLSFSFPRGSHGRAVIWWFSGCCLRMCPRNRHILLPNIST